MAVGELSFFSFQDIITSVTGILLLITLVMAASISRDPARVEAAPAALPRPPVPSAEEAAALDRNSAERAATVEARAIARDAETARLRRGVAAMAAIASAAAPSSGGALALADQVPAMAAAAAPQLDAARAEVARLDEALAAEQAKLEEANRAAVAAAAAAQARPELAFLPGAQRGRPVLVELHKTTIRIGDLDPEGRPRQIASADDVAGTSGALDRAVASLGNGEPLTLVILAHPDGVDRVNDVAADVRRRGLSVGWDVAPGRAVFEAQRGGGDGPTTRP